MGASVVLHSAVQAHTQRVHELSRLYEGLEQAVLRSGGTSANSREAHSALTSRVCSWLQSDVQKEHADVVRIAANEHVRLTDAIADLFSYAEMDPANAVLPESVPRVVLAKLRRSLRRAATLRELQGPAIIIYNEAALARAILDWDRPGEVMPIEFNAEDGFSGTFAWALDVCVVREPARSGGKDMGGGDVSAHPSVREVSDEQLLDLYPFVPTRTFATKRADSLVIDRFEGTGAIGWAADEDLRMLANDLRALGLASVAERYDETRESGRAVIAWLQDSPPESEGERLWLVDQNPDDLPFA